MALAIPFSFPPAAASLLRLHQNDILSKTPDGLPGEDLILLPPEKSEKAEPPRYNQRLDPPSFQVYLYVSHISETASVADIDDFLIPQLCNPALHSKSPVSKVVVSVYNQSMPQPACTMR